MASSYTSSLLICLLTVVITSCQTGNTYVAVARHVNQPAGYFTSAQSVRRMTESSSAYGNVYAVYSGNVSRMTCSFRVPLLPKTFNKTEAQSVFLWCGVEPNGYDVGVLQPVLMYGPCCNSGNGVGDPSDPDYSENPYWYFSAQYVFPNYTTKNCCVCKTGQVFKASPGDLLLSTIEFQEETSTWLVQGMNMMTKNLSVLAVAHPFLNESLQWKDYSNDFASFVDVETYTITNVSAEMPPEENWTVNAAFYDAKGNLIPISKSDWDYNMGPHKQPVVNCTANYCEFDLQAS